MLSRETTPSSTFICVLWRAFLPPGGHRGTACRAAARCLGSLSRPDGGPQLPVQGLGRRYRAAQCLRLSLFALLEPFVECALWPHLYPTKQLCERRLGAVQGEEGGHERFEGESEGPLHCQSLRAHRRHVVRYDPLQFQFDRHILRTVLGSDVAEARPTGVATGPRSTGAGSTGFAAPTLDSRHWQSTCPGQTCRATRWPSSKQRQAGAGKCLGEAAAASLL